MFIFALIRICNPYATTGVLPALRVMQKLPTWPSDVEAKPRFYTAKADATSRRLRWFVF